MNLKSFALLVLAVTLLRSVAASLLPLTGDEAYYWEYARHFAAGYHDHPPMVGWIVALSCAIFGDSTAAVRLPFVAMGAMGTLLIYLTTLRISNSARAATWAGGLLLITPLFTLAGMATFPDGPLLFFVSLFFYLAWRVAAEGGPGRWAAMGAAAGLAATSKLTGLYLLPSFFCFLLLSRTHRRLLLGSGPWLAMASAALMLAPLIHWNSTHGWESFAYQYGSRLGAAQGVKSKYLVTYLALSVAAFSPVLWALAVWATLVAGWQGLKDRDDGLLYVFCMATPIHAFFLACSLVTKIGLHWAAPGTLAACMALGIWLARPRTWEAPRMRLVMGAGVGLSLLISGTIYVAALSPTSLLSVVSGGIQMTGVNKGQPVSGDLLAELLGYPAAARHVSAVAAEMQARGSDPFIFTTNYAFSSALGFYSGKSVHVVMGTRIGAEFDRWDDFPSMLGRDGLYVDTSPIPTREDVWQRLQEAFASVELDPPFTIQIEGVGSRSFYLARCSRFTSDVFTPLKTSVQARQGR